MAYLISRQLQNELYSGDNGADNVNGNNEKRAYNNKIIIPRKYLHLVSETHPQYWNKLYGPDGKVISDLRYVNPYYKPIDEINENTAGKTQAKCPENKPVINNPDNSRNNKKKKGFLRKLCTYPAAAIGTGALLLMLHSGCNPKNPYQAHKLKPEPVYVKIYATGNATYTLGEGAATGKVKFMGNAYDLDANNKSYWKDFDVETQFGTQEYLGMMPEGQSTTYEMQFLGDGALKRIFKQVAMSGTNVYNTDVLKLDGFNLNEFLNLFLQGDKNVRWTQPNITVYFNPDNWSQGTGKRLPQNWIDETKRSINKIKDNSAGFIQSVKYIDDGDKKIDPSVPPNGDIWVFYDSGTHGVANITYPTGYGPVDSAKLLFNPGPQPDDYTDPPPGVEAETIDAFFGYNQNHFPDKYIYNWIKFLFMRPVDRNYRIYADREEQDGFSGSVLNLGQTKVSLFEDPTSVLPNNPLTDLFGEREVRYNKREIEEQNLNIKNPHIKKGKREFE